MAGSVNRVTIVGNVGRDPEVRTTQNNLKIVSLSVATSERWKDRQSGEMKENTEWHRISILNENLADIAERYLRKGSQVYLEGQLKTRKWQDQSGQDRYTTEIVLSRFDGKLVLLGGRGDGDSGEARDNGRENGRENGGSYDRGGGRDNRAGGSGGSYGSGNRSSHGNQSSGSGRGKPPAYEDDLDDSIPF